MSGPRLLSVRRALPRLIVAGWAFVAGPALAAAPTYTREPAPYSAAPRFAVRYAGSGRWHTHYVGRPGNPGGKPDRNVARDSSAQRWDLHFRGRVRVPVCAPVGGACVSPLDGAA